MVLLRNDGVLPLDAASLGRVVVLGELARVANLGDGGSSDVRPPHVVTPLDGLRAALPGVVVDHADDDASGAAGADVTIVVVGCTKADEGEYIDPRSWVASSTSSHRPTPKAPPAGRARAAPRRRHRHPRAGMTTAMASPRW
jgi:beta-glucosidase